MDYQILAIIVLAAMLILSLVWNIILTKKIERLRDADMIDDITFDDEFYNLKKEQDSKIIYL